MFYAALLDKICSLMGGRAAEDMFIGEVTTGALNDLERATKMAYSLVVYYGMGEKMKNISYYDSTGQNYGFTKPYSEERSRAIDEEVSKILAEQYERAKSILSQYKEGHHKLAEELESREVIFTNDVEAIFGPRQWKSHADQIKELNDSKKAESNVDITDVEATDITEDKTSEENKPQAVPPAFDPERYKGSESNNESADAQSENKDSEKEDKTTDTPQK